MFDFDENLMKYNRSPKESVQRARAISRAHKVADNSGIDYPVSTQRASLPRVKLTAKLTHIWQKKVKGTCADFVCAGTLVCPCLELPHNQSRIKGFNASQFSLIDIYFKLNSQKLPSPSQREPEPKALVRRQGDNQGRP